MASITKKTDRAESTVAGDTYEVFYKMIPPKAKEIKDRLRRGEI
jgi:hypothetical protein